ncbi:karyopherin [Lecanora helva]
MSSPKGMNSHSGDGKAEIHTEILRALEVVHEPKTPNDLRQNASRYLEEIRSNEEAPYHGFGLALSKQQPAIVRHYGLSLLEYAVRHRWSDYTTEQRNALREWVVTLAQHATDGDPLYIANKVAELWVEVAKRSWGLEWFDMDELLVRSWDGPLVQKTLVLNVLETLSEEIFGSDDTTVALRGNELNAACIDIFTPLAVLTEQFPKRETTLDLRFGDRGWLTRMADLLDQCIEGGNVNPDQQLCGVKLLTTFKSIISWVIPRALVTTHSVNRICACLAVSNLPLQLAAVDSLYTLYNRTRFSEGDFRDVVGPIFTDQTLHLLKQLHEWLIVDPLDIDEAKYLLLKKFSEMNFNIGRLLEESPSFIPQGSNLAGFLRLLIDIMKNQSLHVSIPALHLWVKLLSSEKIGESPDILPLIGDLLEICSQRLIRFESLPDDSHHPSILFLNEDVDTMPEKHAFLGNYARFCNQIVELVVQKQPIDALYHILAQADHILAHVYDGEPAFQASTYTKTSIPFLRLDAQFNVIEAALKGCLKWLTHSGSTTVEHEHEVMMNNLQSWCDRLLGLIFEDPSIKQRVTQLAVGFAIGPLKRNARFALRIFDYILDMRCPTFPGCVAYNDAVKELQGFSLHQLQRLAMRFADDLVTIFDNVERKLMTVSQEVAPDIQTKARYSSVLFIIVHRAPSVEANLRQARLDQFLQPLIDQWQSPTLSHSLSSFTDFNRLLGLDNIQQYLISRAVHQIHEWSLHTLDDEGKVLQENLQRALDGLPLRATKAIMSVSIERLEESSEPFKMACKLWQKNIPFILPNLLQFISRSQAFHDPNNWSDLPPEMLSVVRRILTDRFWQVGISQGSRDDFYAKVGDTKTTMEGLASTIRGTIRTVRETGYRLLYYMSLLGESFYSFEELPGPLSQALFRDACALSPHQIAILVEMVRPVIDNCPKKSRSHFLPPILSALFEQLDRKASAEWMRIEARKEAAAEEDDLTSEMKDESILRQLTMASVMLVVGLLEPGKPGKYHHILVEDHLLIRVSAMPPTSPDTVGTPAYETTRDFILQTLEILKPLIMFCTHALRMRDTRACSMITRVLRSIVPEFAGENPVESDVREFISTEVLKACITSINDPYFVELQKDFAQLIASILISYTPRTDTPKQILLSLPGMSAERLEKSVRHLYKAQQATRQQRAIVLELLEGFRGVAIHEQGKLPKPNPKKMRSAMQEKYMTVEVQANGKKEASPDLGGIADMFG